MLLYIIYNANMEIIGDKEKEDSLGYVDNLALLAIGKDFNETTSRLEYLMSKNEGGTN